MRREERNLDESRGMKPPSEQLGRVSGWLSAPFWAAGSAIRHARVLHPVGQLVEATVEVVDDAPEDLAALAAALEGRALVRFSGALWKKAGTHLPDVLGCAVRIRDGARDDQDLLFATIKRPWTLGFAPLTTDVDDYLANQYFAISPFDLAGVAKRFYLRLRPRRSGGGGETRAERLSHAVNDEDHPVVLAIEASYGPRGPWREVARLGLERVLDGDDPELRFNPFEDGRGIRPRGIIHALRRGAYHASQSARVRLKGVRPYSKAHAI